MDRGGTAHARGRRGVIRVCFHGAESTGKSVLAASLAAELGCPLVGEYGRAHAEARGTEFTMADLLEIAREQDRLMREAATRRPALLLLDTDPLMTAAWAEMLFGEVPGEILAYDKAELYLLFAPDVPWIADGTRFFGTPAERARFAETAEAMLVRTGVPYRTVTGDWSERERQVRAALHEAGAR
jgi:NadR type nicotinamide-nucleotide adenylyltransferase